VGGVRKHIYSYLSDFLFTPERTRTPVKALSGGERARLMLAKLFLKPSNLLVLDEPTNDLDIETLELLEERLMAYKGTLLLVSHDREFFDNVVTSTFALEGDGAVDVYPGGYEDYFRQRRPREKEVKTADPVPGPKPRAQARKLSYNEQRELASLPAKIEALESEIAQMESFLSDGRSYVSDPDKYREFSDRLPVLRADLDASVERWAELESLG
jgi:ATP-binding cassette subfamily F protein uup